MNPFENLKKAMDPPRKMHINRKELDKIINLIKFVPPVHNSHEVHTWTPRGYLVPLI